MGAEGKVDLKLTPGYEPEWLTGATSGNKAVFTTPATSSRLLSIPEATTGKPLVESFDQTVLADNLSSGTHPAGRRVGVDRILLQKLLLQVFSSVSFH